MKLTFYQGPKHWSELASSVIVILFQKSPVCYNNILYIAPMSTYHIIMLTRLRKQGKGKQFNKPRATLFFKEKRAALGEIQTHIIHIRCRDAGTGGSTSRN